MKQVVVISGPTGSGESTLTKEFIARYPKKVARLVTATTRTPRLDEKSGVDYYFLTQEDFFSAEARGDILEKGYIPNRDAYYGTYKPDLDTKIAQGLIIIANTQIVGTKYFKQEYGATTIFIMPKDVKELRERLGARDPNISSDELSRRLDNANAEIKDEGPFYDYNVINADGHLSEAVDEVVAILKKEGYSFE